MTLTKLILTVVAGSALCFGQTFTSGSTGSDGALNLTTPGTIDFDPAALGLNPSGDNIFHFTTINIGPGVIVKMRASKLREKSVVFLATGAVTIAGTLDLSGAVGYLGTAPASVRTPSEPGPGGYAGGVAARVGSAAQPGAGPGGGTGCGSYATSGCQGAGPIYGNSLLVPLRGGSGGGGGDLGNDGGGAGGGAIRIVSTISITINGSVLANGGNGGKSGSGGAIHLQAPLIAGSGTISAIGGNPTQSFSFGGPGNGRIRIDSTTNTSTATINPAPVTGPLFNVPLPTGVPSVTITNIGGVSISASPTGSFTSPDATINASVAVPVTFTATNIPIGTVVKLIVSSETGADQTVSATPLTGTVANSTGTASVLWPLGVSRVFIRAVW